MILGLKDKFAIITGGSHGIGLATAISLAKEGCNICIISRCNEKLREAKSKVEAYGVECNIIQADVLNDQDIEECFAKINSLYSHIDILINNVGGGGRWGLEDIEQTDDCVWEEVYKKNFTCALKFTKLVLPYMKKQSWGRVITVTSTLGRQGGGRPWFNVAKTSQTCLMKNLSLNKDLVRHNITFNSIAPGCIMIPGTGWEAEEKADPKKFKKMVQKKFPLGRLGTPKEVGDVICFLCSSQASLINGAAIAVDGAESTAF